jgi:hypothetical protein
VKRALLAAVALVALAGCDASPSAAARAEVVDAREAGSIIACHDAVRTGADICRVTSGPETGAVVEPAGRDQLGRVTAAVTTRRPGGAR